MHHQWEWLEPRQRMYHSICKSLNQYYEWNHCNYFTGYSRSLCWRLCQYAAWVWNRHRFQPNQSGYCCSRSFAVAIDISNDKKIASISPSFNKNVKRLELFSRRFGFYYQIYLNAQYFSCASYLLKMLFCIARIELQRRNIGLVWITMAINIFIIAVLKEKARFNQFFREGYLNS